MGDAAKLRAEAQNLAAVAVKLEVRCEGALRARSSQLYDPINDGLHIAGGQVGHGGHGHGTPHALAAFLYLGAQQRSSAAASGGSRYLAVMAVMAVNDGPTRFFSSAWQFRQVLF